MVLDALDGLVSAAINPGNQANQLARRSAHDPDNSQNLSTFTFATQTDAF
jgi:hypothetical protein